MGADRLIVHVLPADLPRGAQALARAICDELDGEPDRNVALTLFAGPPGKLLPEHHLDAPDGRLRSAGLSPVAAWRLRRWVRRERPAVIISHGGEPLKYLPFAVPRRIPTVYYRVGTANEHLAATWQRRLYRALVGRCRAVVAVSEETAVEAAELFDLPVADIAVIHNARDPEVYRRPDGDRDPDAEVVVAYVGQVSEAKGADRFVRAMASLRADGHRVRGVVAGEGPLLEPLRAEAAAAGVELRGVERDVVGLLGAADVFAFPGVDREGMPGVLIEAGLCSLPSVATDLPGVRAVVDDGTSGFVIAPGDDDALVDRLRELVTSAELRAAMGAAARQRCVERFSIRAIGDRWREELARLSPG